MYGTCDTSCLLCVLHSSSSNVPASTVEHAKNGERKILTELLGSFFFFLCRAVFAFVVGVVAVFFFLPSTGQNLHNGEGKKKMVQFQGFIVLRYQ